MIASSLASTATAGIVAALTGALMGGMPSSPAAGQAERLVVAAARQSVPGHPAPERHRAVTDIPPAGRQWTGFAFDTALGEFVLFGGDDFSAVFGDTWTRKHGLWTERHPATSPSPRTGAAMVYDTATRQLLLFGGSTGSESGFQASTWLWTGTNWRLLHPSASPPARHNADMIYDAATGDVIMFGGYDGSYLGDTWSWNGTTWTRLHPATAHPLPPIAAWEGCCCSGPMSHDSK